MSPVLEPLFQSPRLPLYVAELNEQFAREREAREHFRNTITPSEKGEFINGEVLMHSPAKFRHTNARVLITRLLSIFVHKHTLGWVGDEKMLVGLSRNDFEPDIVFYASEKFAKFTPDQLVFPAPDLVVEILSDSTEARDRGVKMEDYAAHCVTEYWLVDADKETVEQYVLEADRYSLRSKQNEGVLRSQAVAGFCMPVRAAFDAGANYQALAELTRAAG